MCNDNFNISLKFENGSIANIVYTSDGSTAVEKEYIEVFGGGRSAKIIDFQQLGLFENNKRIFNKNILPKIKDKKQ